MLIYLSLIEEDTEREKFEILYDAYRNLMFYIANEVLGDTQDSEDVVHQSFLKIIGILDKISQPKCPQTRALVVTIVRRTAIDLYRSRKRKPFIPLCEDIPHTHPMPEPDALAEGSAIAHAIASLPDRYRELLLLKYDTGYSEKEIAQLLGMTEANVKKTIQRAKAKLQTLLDEMEADV